MNSSIEISRQSSNDLNNGFIYEDDNISMITISDTDIDNYYLEATTQNEIDGNDSIDYSLIEQFRAVENIEIFDNENDQLNKSFEYIVSLRSINESNLLKQNVSSHNTQQEFTTITNELNETKLNNSTLSSLISPSSTSEDVESNNTTTILNKKITGTNNKNEKSVIVNCKTLCSHLMKPITNRIINKMLKKKKSTSSSSTSSIITKSTNISTSTDNSVNKLQMKNDNIRIDNNIEENRINNHHNNIKISKERKIRIKIIQNKLRNNQQLDDYGMKSSEFDKLANNYFSKCGDIVYYNV